MTPGGGLATDMCGLAKVLDDDVQYGYLGGADGAERLGMVFNDFTIAKWVDDPTYDASYDFGEHLSPSRDFGLFRKVDTGWDPNHPYNCWELAVPPRFVVGVEAEGTWWSVPGNASECGEDGWNDPQNHEYCDLSYCDPVVARLWGSDYLVFQADTLEYQYGDGKCLKVELAWGDNIPEGTALWVDLLKYHCCPDSLYFRGSQLASVAKQRFEPGDTGVTISAHGFGEGGTESMVVALTLVQTDLEHHEDVCGPLDGCRPRILNDSLDLPYSYRFRVYDEPSGGGCPFVASYVGGDYRLDNNVLAGASLGTDETDVYLLEVQPADAGGLARLTISEDESERSLFDRAALLAVDVPEGVVPARLPDGTMAAIGTSLAPVSCIDMAGHDVLGLVTSDDDQVVVIPAGGWITVRFAPEGRPGGGIGTDGNPGQKIDPPGGRGTAGDGGTIDLTALCYRARECVTMLDVPMGAAQPDGSILVTLSSPVEYELDRLFYGVHAGMLPQVTPCELVSASQTSDGSVVAELRHADGTYAELLPGEAIELGFSVPAARPATDRYYALVTRGRYEHLGDRDAPVSPPDERQPTLVSAWAWPNPATSVATVRFDVPAPGGHTTVRVYDLAGRIVRELGHDELWPGSYELEWDGRNDRGAALGAGVYFFRIDTAGRSVQKKVVIVR